LYRHRVPRVVELPDRGRLIVATDLQGNVADFERISRIFRKAAAEPDGAALVVTGDLVHGPEIPETHWPEYLGTYFRADSKRLLELAEELAQDHPGRVHYLLGNHEHAHIGGPIVSKFFANEALRLERLMGADRSQLVRAWFRSWPLVAVARRAGILMLHAAPNAPITSPSDLERVRLDPPGGPEGVVDEVLAEVLWARTASESRAWSFLRAFDAQLQVAIFGHDVARAGYGIDHEPLLCISTSFGCFDGDKLYLDWDLARPARSAHEVASLGLRPLHPEAKPVFRTT
jgi:calcineurin-like phosphoesterase family protein